VDLRERKALAGRTIDTMADRLWDLSRRIHAEPETAFEEFNAVRWLSEELTDLGFDVEQGVADLPTAFKATTGGSPSPTIAIHAEYDALPEIGHGCGHNVIAVGAVAAGAAVKAAMHGLGGRLVVMGTPAEEEGGGKIIMLERGAYSDVDVALYIHPQTHNAVMGSNFAYGTVELRFEGVPASESGGEAPQGEEHRGASALDGLLAAFNNVSLVRSQIQRDVLVRGVITEGGAKSQFVALRAVGWFAVRAPTHSQVASTIDRIVTCALAGAAATGTAVEVDPSRIYAERVPNGPLMDAMRENMVGVGLAMADEGLKATSYTDSGNISQSIPLVAGRISIADAASGVTPHSAAFALAAGSEGGRAGMLAAGKVLAWTALDLLALPGLVAKAQDDFRARTEREPSAKGAPTTT
jgi:amidohydrolase